MLRARLTSSTETDPCSAASCQPCGFETCPAFRHVAVDVNLYDTWNGVFTKPQLTCAPSIVSEGMTYHSLIDSVQPRPRGCHTHVQRAAAPYVWVDVGMTNRMRTPKSIPDTASTHLQTSHLIQSHGPHDIACLSPPCPILVHQPLHIVRDTEFDMGGGETIADQILKTFVLPDVVGSKTSPKKLINLLRGWPNVSLLPTQLLDKAAHNVLQKKPVAYPAMCYGPDSGDPRLRNNIAKWLTTFYKPAHPVSEERICISGGASQNLACLLQDFTDPVYTRNVWIVAPAYMLAFRIFEDAGFHKKLRAVPEDEEGIDMSYLRSQIRQSEERAKSEKNDAPQFKPPRPSNKIYKHVIYAVPGFSNPSSKTMSLKRREEMVRLAREYDALIITDDVYDFLQWPSSLNPSTLSIEKAGLPRIVDIDRYLDGGAERSGADGFGNAVSNGSFSKIFGPGLRTGWCEGTPKMAYGVSQTGSSRSGGAPSQLTACFVAETLETGELQRYVYDRLQPTYGNRYRRMVEAINKHLLPLGIRISQTDREIVGGYFIWLTLPSPLKGAAVAQRAKEDENLAVAQGEMFEVPGDTEHKGTSFSNDVRVCFAWEEEDMLAEGIERLATVISRMLKEGANGGQSTHRAAAQEDAKNLW